MWHLVFLRKICQDRMFIKLRTEKLVICSRRNLGLQAKIVMKNISFSQVSVHLGFLNSFILREQVLFLFVVFKYYMLLLQSKIKILQWTWTFSGVDMHVWTEELSSLVAFLLLFLSLVVLSDGTSFQFYFLSLYRSILWTKILIPVCSLKHKFRHYKISEQVGWSSVQSLQILNHSPSVWVFFFPAFIPAVCCPSFCFNFSDGYIELEGGSKGNVIFMSS